MKRGIGINIWDDYEQKPEYSVNNDTVLYVEEGDRFNKQENNEIIQLIYDYILKNIDIEEVKYKIDSGFRGNEIIISNLSTKKKHELLNRLDKSNLEYKRDELIFYSES